MEPIGTYMWSITAPHLLTCWTSNKHWARGGGGTPSGCPAGCLSAPIDRGVLNSRARMYVCLPTYVLGEIRVGMGKCFDWYDGELWLCDVGHTVFFVEKVGILGGI